MKNIRRFRPILAQQITKLLGGSSLLSSGNNKQDLAPDSNSQGKKCNSSIISVQNVREEAKKDWWVNEPNDRDQNRLKGGQSYL